MIADMIAVAAVLLGMTLVFAGVVIAWERFVYWTSERDLRYARRRERALTVMDTWFDDDDQQAVS